MTKADVRALIKGVQKKMSGDKDLAQVLENIEEVSAILVDSEEDAPRIRLPYVNATPLDSGQWK